MVIVMAFKPSQSALGDLNIPPLDALSLTFRRASPWLLETSCELIELRPLRHRDLCNAVLGCFVVTRVLEILAPNASNLDILSGVKHALSNALDLAWADAELSGSDINLLVLTARILFGEGAPSLSLQRLCDSVLHELNILPSAGGSADNGELLSLMHVLGFPITPTTRTNVEKTASRTALDASDGEVSHLVAQIEQESLWGTKRLTATLEPAWTLELLAGLAAHRYKYNSLLIANRMLRAYDYRCAAGHGLSASRSDLYSLLLAMQREDGSFGWLGSEAAQLVRVSGRATSPKYALYLPITADCLWTLAECSGLSWRLMSSIGKTIAQRDDIE